MLLCVVCMDAYAPPLPLILLVSLNVEMCGMLRLWHVCFDGRWAHCDFKRGRCHG